MELNGRRLIIVPAVKREDVEKVKEESSEKKKKMQDKRNIHLLKEGLTNANDFINNVFFRILIKKSVSETEIEKRQKLADSKEENMRKNPNYRVSLTSIFNKFH